MRWVLIGLTLMLSMTGCDRKKPPEQPSAVGGSGSVGLIAPGSHSEPSVPALAGTISLSGSSTVAPLVAELGKAFETRHPAVRINVEMGGSSRGIADARAGLVDIGMVSRALKPDESDLKAHTIARDGIAMIVHSGVPVKELSRERIIAIYTGEMTNWRDIGGEDRAITVVNKAEGRSTLELFLHYTGLKAPQIKASVVIGDNQQGIKSVASIPGAIGYVSIGAAEAAAAEGASIRLLPLGGVEPTMSSVRNGTFPISRPLNLVTKGEPGEVARAFIEFCRSADADATIQELFFVPQR